MEHKREATGCYFIYTYLCMVYVDTYMWTHSEIEQSLPRCCTRFFKREFLLFRVLLYMYIYVYVCRLFSPNMRAIFLQLVCKSNRKKKERGQRKNIFWYEEQRRVSSPATRVAQIFDNCQRQRNAPSHRLPCVRAINLYLQT